MTQSFESAKSYFKIGGLLIYYGSGSISVPGKRDTAVTITFSPAFADTNYAVFIGCKANSGYAAVSAGHKEKAEGSVKLNFWNEEANYTYTYEYTYLIIGKVA